MVCREHENELETTKLELEFNKLKVQHFFLQNVLSFPFIKYVCRIYLINGRDKSSSQSSSKQTTIFLDMNKIHKMG
jgi:hypothetical protein